MVIASLGGHIGWSVDIMLVFITSKYYAMTETWYSIKI